MGSIHEHRQHVYRVPAEGGRRRFVWAVHETSPAGPPKPRLLDRVRTALRARHYSPRTEEAYVAWIRRYIFFHGKRHPAEMGSPEITRFLSALAVNGKVAASTQNQALSACSSCIAKSWRWTFRDWMGSYGQSARNGCRWS